MTHVIDNNSFTSLLKFNSFLMIIQNLVLVSWFFLINNDILGEDSTLVSVGFSLDIIVFAIFVLIGIYALTLNDEKPIAWLFVIIGAIIFLGGALAYRPILGVFPENPISEFAKEQLISSDPTPSDEVFDLSFVGEIWEGIIIANFGLLLFSIGLAVRIKSRRWAIVLYGLINFLMSFNIIILLFKVLVSLPLVLIYFSGIISKDPYDYLY